MLGLFQSWKRMYPLKIEAYVKVWAEAQKWSVDEIELSLDILIPKIY